MSIRLDISSLKETRPYEFGLRFLFGGLCTAIAGLIAKIWGPVVGGLFLAFPAIFPAAVSLIQSHEVRRKAEAGGSGHQRGKDAAALDAFGAALGCVGLAAFALVLWKGIVHAAPALILASAFCVWAGVTWLCYLVRRRIHRARRPALTS